MWRKNSRSGNTAVGGRAQAEHDTNVQRQLDIANSI